MGMAAPVRGSPTPARPDPSDIESEIDGERSMRMMRRLKSAARVLLRPQPSAAPIEGLSEVQVERVRFFFPLEKYFIFGHARSGTTLLARLVRVHPEVHCNYQAHFFTRPPYLTSLLNDPEAVAWLRRRNNRWNDGKDPSGEILRVVADYLMEREARTLNKRIVGDKSPSNMANGDAVRRLHDLYPEARLITIVRDGRDVAVSHLMQAFVDDVDELNGSQRRIRQALLRDPEAFQARGASLFGSSDLRKRARLWASNVEETERLGRELLGDRFLQVRYEDLVLEPLEAVSVVWRFLGVDPDFAGASSDVTAACMENPDADWQKKSLPGLANWVSKGGPGAWKEWFNREDCAVFEAEAGSLLTRLGYERSMDDVHEGGSPPPDRAASRGSQV
jgi:hypothetical protein